MLLMWTLMWMRYAAGSDADGNIGMIVLSAFYGFRDFVVPLLCRIVALI